MISSILFVQLHLGTGDCSSRFCSSARPRQRVPGKRGVLEKSLHVVTLWYCWWLCSKQFDHGLSRSGLAQGASILALPCSLLEGLNLCVSGRPHTLVELNSSQLTRQFHDKRQRQHRSRLSEYWNSKRKYCFWWLSVAIVCGVDSFYFFFSLPLLPTELLLRPGQRLGK